MSNRKNTKYQADLRDYLSKQQLVHKICKDADLISELHKELDALAVTRLKAASDIRLALVKKYLPDVKQLELMGENGGPIETVTRIEREIIKSNNT